MSAKLTDDPDYFTGYENEPIGGGNPYYRCCDCGRSDPEINMRRSGHYETCRHYRPLGATQPNPATQEETKP